LNIDVLDGLPHTIVGLGVFAVTLVLVASTDRVFEFFLSHRYSFWRRRERERAVSDVTTFPQLKQTLFGSFAALPIAVLFGLVLLVQLVLLIPTGSVAEVADTSGPPSVFDHISQKTMPSVWSGRPLASYGTQVERLYKAVHSRYWSYGGGNNRMYAAVDYPFSKWHDLTSCYRGLGWTVDSKLYNPPVQSTDLPFYEFELNQQPLGYGFVVYFLFDNQGKPLTPTVTENLVSQLGHRAVQRAAHVRENWQAGGRQIAGEDLTQYIQFQVFLTSMTPITDQQRADCKRLFKMLYEQVIQTDEGPSSGN
ncbi:MAG TPA: exosortase U, partial [Pirellulales bacterium]|nr:exosortase U [Pirellulales bacterium]